MQIINTILTNQINIESKNKSLNIHEYLYILYIYFYLSGIYQKWMNNINEPKNLQF